MITLNLLRMFWSCETDIELSAPNQVAKNELKKVKTIRQLDSAVTAKLYKLPDLEAYYRESSCISVMDRVSIPMLCLNALDDPLIDVNISQQGKAFSESNHNIISVLTSHGGHLGWVYGWRTQWMSTAISEYLLAMHDALLHRTSPMLQDSKHKLSLVHEGDNAQHLITVPI